MQAETGAGGLLLTDTTTVYSKVIVLSVSATRECVVLLPVAVHVKIRAAVAVLVRTVVPFSFAPGLMPGWLSSQSPSSRL